MSDHGNHLHHHHHHHHHQHRPHRISVPPRFSTNPTAATSTPTSSSRTPYPLYPSTTTTPTPTPSKPRLSSSAILPFPSAKSSSSANKSSLSFLFLLLLLSLRSLYSLLPFLRSSPSFSLFPFSFLVSLLSFLLSYAFSAAAANPSPNKNPFHFKTNHPTFSLSSISPSQHQLLLSKSLLLAVVFLLRFQALRYCGTAAMILAEMSGNVVARFIAEGRKHGTSRSGSSFQGFLALCVGLLLLSVSWDRIDCFPFSTTFVDKFGFSVVPRESCVRFWPMLLPFLSGFLGCYERVSMNWSSIRQLGRKRVRLVSLFYTTVLLFIPAVVSFFVYEGGSADVSLGNLGWPLANTVVFGVLLCENYYCDEKLVSSNDFRREFLVTFVCTIVLELFYFPELSLWGLLLCGFLLYLAVRKLDPIFAQYVELGLESPEPFSDLVMKPVRHILSERKSRKIALFLLINTAYMVVEFVAGFLSNSLGLISDACHMLFDCAALAIGLYASYISRLPANNQFNYGRGRFEVLSGYVNAVFLVLVGALIVLESFERILDPQEISTNSLLSVSIGGLVVNVVGLIFFHEEHHHAHGGLSGSCSHLHAHTHSHHHRHSHDHEVHENHLECVSVSYGCDDEQHDPHQCSHSGGIDSCRVGSSNCLDDHSHNHDHHNHAHKHCDYHDRADHHEPKEHLGHSHHHHHHDTDNHVHGSLPDTCTHAQHSDPRSDSLLGNSGSCAKPSSVEGPKNHHHHHHIDHNMEGIFLHVLADTMGSVGVVISTLLIKYKGWLVADPACSIFISVLIVSSVIPLLRNSAEILLQRVPRAHEHDLNEAVKDVMRLKGVRGIQNLHVWSFTNTDIVGTMHLHVLPETDKASLKGQVTHIFHDAGIKDLTVQVEWVK